MVENPTFLLERDGDTLVVTPQADLSELEYQQIEGGAREVLSLLGEGEVRNVVLDFHRSQYFGSTALGFFVKLWKRVRERGGHMAFCNVSGRGREILEVTKLTGLWPTCASRADALREVRAS